MNQEEQFELPKALSALNGIAKIKEAERYDNPMWLFQFDDDEPEVFGVSEGAKEITLVVKNSEYSNIVFTSKEGKKFKIFAAENKDNITLNKIGTP